MKLSGLCLCSPGGWGGGVGEPPPQGQAQCLFCPSPCLWPHRAWHRASVHISHSLTPSPLLCSLSSWQLASPRPHHVQVPETLKRIRYGSGVQPAHTLGGDTGTSRQIQPFQVRAAVGKHEASKPKYGKVESRGASWGRERLEGNI